MARKRRRNIGNLIAPPRFILFALTLIGASWYAIHHTALGWRHGLMLGFDSAALFFFLICIPLLGHKAERMRISACRNDGNRLTLLLITGAVMLVILSAIATELMQKEAHKPMSLLLIIGTLAVAWIFSNVIYTLHYAHLFYQEGPGGDCGGLTFPETPEPDYWDFIYCAFCLGMTFQTSDVVINHTRMRRVVTLHCLAAFVFNIGIIAFSINVLGGG